MNMPENCLKINFYKSSPFSVTVLLVSYLSIIVASNEDSPILNLKKSNKLVESYRLAQTIKPIHYEIIFCPSLHSDIFNGEVNITVNVTEPTFEFTVHEKGLDILKSEVYDVEQSKLLIIESRSRSGMDHFVIQTKNEVQPGKYILNFEFNGVYEHGVGLYREEYDYSDNDKRYFAMTFFAPIYARRAFPCFDEPSFKATFSVAVFHDSTHFAISNMPVELETNLESNKKFTKFEKTPPMSTYLLCIVVCDFEHKETTTDNGIKIRAYASKNTIDKIETALNWTSEILTYFENYLNVSYPLEKLDIISLPEFDANGMENWGLITYKEQSLLIDNTSTVNHKSEVANLVAHELAHMWFGDLVTMDWWNETWLNEGFATHFAWKGAKHVLPEYFTVDDSGILEVCNIMQQDETIQTRSVIRTVNEVIYSDVYSSIVYKKGASLLRMLEKYIKESDFINGISRYIKQLAKKLYRKYRWNNEGNFLEKKLRIALINAMCDNNARSCLEIASDAYKKWMNGEMLDSETAELVYKYGLKKLNDEISYNHMWSRYLNETNPLLKGQYRDALSNVRKSSLLKRLLKDCMEGKYFRLTWQVSMIKSIAENERGFSIVSSYIRNKWNDLVRKYGKEQAENIAETVFSKYQTKEDLLQVQEFYKKHPTTKSIKTRSRTLDSIKLRINWKLKFQGHVTEWFLKEKLI